MLSGKNQKNYVSKKRQRVEKKIINLKSTEDFSIWYERF